MSREETSGRTRPLTMLVGALGGEGGGLLADWIVDAAGSAGVLVQSTSIPGVAQRTGATTYYLEMMVPAKGAKREPVFGLYPAPGYLDIVLTSELVEAGRALQNGFVTPERTTLISSVHRVMAMSEKMSMGNGIYNTARIFAAAQELAKRSILRDFQTAAIDNGTALNALLLGALAETGLCPITAKQFEAAIKSRGVAVDANLAGFRLGLKIASGEVAVPSSPADKDTKPVEEIDGLPVSLAAVCGEFPGEARPIIAEGCRRLIDYQDQVYAVFYLERLKPIFEADRRAGGAAQGFAFTRDVARLLAVWMSYEDVIRVADFKSRRERYERVARETQAKPGEPIRITEFLKPGLEELMTVLPAFLGRRMMNWARKRDLSDKLHLALHLRSDTVSGYLRLRMLAKLKVLRRRGLRYHEEQALIQRWLDCLLAAIDFDYDLASALVGLGGLIKGYSDTRTRAIRNFLLIMDEIADPAIKTEREPKLAAQRVAEACAAALADDEGIALADVMAPPEPTPKPVAKRRKSAAKKRKAPLRAAE